MTAAQKQEPIELDGVTMHTVHSLAQHFSVSVGTIESWIDNGEVPVWQPGGSKGHRWIPESELALWAAARSSARKAPHKTDASKAPPRKTSSRQKAQAEATERQSQDEAPRANVVSFELAGKAKG